VTDEIDAHGPAGVVPRWLSLAPSARGVAIAWDGADGVREGTTAGLDADGALLVRTAGGVERILSGEIRWK
jgi:biotin-(acetyl-CoA carboxylase) ligase